MSNQTLEFDGLPSLTSQYIRAFLPRPGLQKNTLQAPEASATNVRIDAEKLGQYARICGFSTTNTTPQTLPPTYPQVLAAPLHAALFASPAFAHSPLGLVHTHQQIHQIRPIHVTETLDLTARLLAARTTKRGTEFDIETTVHINKSPNKGELVWQSTATMLVRAKKSPSKKSKPSSRPVAEEVTPHRSVILKAPEDLGRRYAATSGDYNPIHLYAATARPFGFRRPIIHGMWSLARSVAELHDDITPENLHIYAEFHRPIYLPSSILFTSTSTPDPTNEPRINFSLRTPDARKNYLVGHTQNLP